MKKFIQSLHKIASKFENKQNYEKANKFHSLFLKFSNQQDEHSHDPEDPIEDDYESSSENENINDILRRTPYKVIVDFTTGQPVVHNGKILATYVHETDYPEIKRKVKEITGIDTLAIKEMMLEDFNSVEFIDTDESIRELELLAQAFQDGVELIPDFVYILFLDTTILSFDKKVVVFGSESDAYSYGEVVQKTLKRNGTDANINLVQLSVYSADSRQPGMSLSEVIEDKEFIWLDDSSFQSTEIPETIFDVERFLEYASIGSSFTVDRLQRQKEGDYSFMEDEDKLASSLEKLHRLASILEEKGLFSDASIANELFVRLAKKKKKSSGKNVPNNPSLWASCKAQAKAKFDVYPSAYANGWAAKQYKSKGGTWRKAK